MRRTTSLPPAAGIGGVPAKFPQQHFPLLLVIAVGLFVLANGFSQLALAFPEAGSLAAVTIFAGLALVIVALARPALPERFGTYLFAGVLTLAAVYSYMNASVSSALPSDEVEVTSAAARAVVSGSNPYTIDYLATDTNIDAQPSAWFTPTYSGSHLFEYVYPAGLVLAVAPVVALFGTGSLTHLYPLVLILSFLVAWVLVPRASRILVVVLLLLMLALGTVTGFTDPMYTPFLVLALWRWPRFVMPDQPLALRLSGPLCFGIACAMKQNVWFIAPFLFLGVALEAYERRRAWLPAVARYVGIVAAVFAVINGPFIATNAAAWWRALTLPFSAHTVLNGDGFAALPLASPAGGDHLELLSTAAAVTFLATALFAAGFYRHVRGVLPLLAGVPLMVSTRSGLGYLFFLLLPALVAALTIPGLPEQLRSTGSLQRWSRRGAACLAVVAAGLVGFVVVQKGPLQLAVVSDQVSGNRWSSVTVQVYNPSTRTITPSFFAQRSEVENFTLVRVDGPMALQPGSAATYRLQPLPTDIQLQPGIPIRIEALADQPESISRSDVFVVGRAATP